MTTKAFEPKFMKVGVFTAALQELTPRDVRDPDPDQAIEDWLQFATELGAKWFPMQERIEAIQQMNALVADMRKGMPVLPSRP